MQPLSKVNWGPDDALANDPAFSRKWIEPPEIQICLDESKWVISGEKGCGKSAIARALREIHSNRFDVAEMTNFNDITFAALYRNIASFAKTTNLDRTVTLSQYWQFSIILELIKCAAKNVPASYLDLYKRTQAMGHADEMPHRLLGLIEKAWNKLDEMTGIKSRQPSEARRFANLIETVGITAKDLVELGKYPLDDKFFQLKSEFFRVAQEAGHRIIFIMDGLDKIDNTDINPQSMSLIFSSLIDAVIAIKNDKEVPPSLFLKAIIPHDRYIGIKLRDSDKLDMTHSAIRWSRETLRDFLHRRIRVSLKDVSDNFSNSWREIMPDDVYNKSYGVKEDSFEYLVRHTMYRPRQLQIILEDIATKYRGKLIESSMIPGCVADRCAHLTRHYINEYSIDHPKLGHFLQLFDKKDNVMEFKSFREIVHLGLQKFIDDAEKRPAIEDKIDSLYVMGFFGIVHELEPFEPTDGRYTPPTKEGKRHWVEFFYKVPSHSIVGRLRDHDLVALHPMFIEGANLRANPRWIIG